MAIDTAPPRSRRSLLTAMAGAAAAAVAAAIGRPLAAEASTDHISLTNDETDAAVIEGHSVHQNGIPQSGQGVGLMGTTQTGDGVSGIAEGDGGIGVYGEGTFASTGVYGISSDGTGVFGRSDRGLGVVGRSGSGLAGVHGNNAGDGSGVSGQNVVLSSNGYLGGANGVFGQVSGSTGSGVVGYSGTSVPMAGPAGTGVYGYSVGGRGGVFRGSAAQLKLIPSKAKTHPGSGQAGDLFVDVTGSLWYCKGGATWVKLA